MIEKIIKNRKIKKPKSYRNIFIIFALVALITFTVTFQYYKNLHGAIRDESRNYLKEIASRISSNIDRITQNNFSVLNIVASSFKDLNTMSFSEIDTILKKQQLYWNYDKIFLIDDRGKSYGLEDQETFLTIDASMVADLVGKKQTMSATQMINNKEYIIFAIPIENVLIDGKQMLAVAGIFDPAYLDQILSMSSFDEKAYSQLITKNGSVVTRSSSAFAIEAGYNIFSSIQNAKFDDKNSLEKVKNDISNNISGQIEFTIGEISRYMIYTPIELNDWCLLTFVPMQAVNAKSDMILNITLIICGLIAIIFSALIAILTYIFNKHKQRLEQIAYVDEVTGGNTIQRFYNLANDMLNSYPNRQYALVYTNFEKFKVLNEQIGRQNCDVLLRQFSEYISSALDSFECMGHLFADNFCILMEYVDENKLLDRFSKWQDETEEYILEGKIPWNLPIAEFGIYVIENRNLSFHQMIDRAKLSLKETTRNFSSKLRYSFYDDEVRRTLFREKQLEDMMEQAIVNNEFKVHLQPKYRVDDEKIGGAEALVRWQSSSEGMIFPNEFIPLFERNGFIIKLDLWVFEEVCRTIRRWIDEGRTPVMVSVNCSRIHLKDLNFINYYRNIADKYNIPKNYLEIELTESVVLENVNLLTKIIDDIHDAGFECSMDDFGSGYSSLNLIQSIHVDTLKLDKIFFNEDHNDSERIKAIVGSIITMAKALSMKTVAEGVENYAHVEMLRDAGCDYIQGYVFSKPVNIRDFEKLVDNEM